MASRGFPTMRPCRSCGKEFMSAGPSQSCCSQACFFFLRVDRRGEDECWVWKGATHGSAGYGAVSVRIATGWREKYGKMLYAHRMSYLLFKGELVKGLDVRHTCDNRPCVNPKHLILGTRKENVADMFARGRESKMRGFLVIAHQKKQIDDLRIKLAEAQALNVLLMLMPSPSRLP